MKPHGRLCWLGFAIALGSACSEDDVRPTNSVAGAAGESLENAGAPQEAGSSSAETGGAAGSESGSGAVIGGSAGGHPGDAGAEATSGGDATSAGTASQAPLGPPSCMGSSSNSCGPNQDDDCCASLPVPGGSFLREYDGLIATDDRWPATVSDFMLDKYEVTVGRFRRFVDAWVAGYRPEPGSGKHQHLPGGRIVNELGWESIWDDLLPATAEEWDAFLACDSYYGLYVWTSAPGEHETKPINCITWEPAYAFCIYDGGFLPTHAESNYAAAGGDEQRLYPWSSPPQAIVANPSHAVYGCRADGSPGNHTGYDLCKLSDIPVVGSRSPKGDGRWGHSDLGGSMNEWLLDARNGVLVAGNCIDCADLLDAYGWRTFRVGDFETNAANLQVAKPGFGFTSYRSRDFGFRCARSPLEGSAEP